MDEECKTIKTLLIKEICFQLMPSLLYG